MNKIIIPALVLILSSCNNNANVETKTDKCRDNVPYRIDQANWFLGTWESRTTEDVYTETWTYKNDSVYEGVSTVVVMQKDTMFFESIALEQKGRDLFYNVSVKDQNGGLPVSFKLTSDVPDELVFENPEHDFPTKIIYTKITADSVVATISGNVAGKEKMEQFPMKKIK